MDSADEAQLHQEREIAFLTRVKKKSFVPSYGKCLFCDQSVAKSRLFCDSDCKEDYEKLQYSKAQKKIS